MADGAPVSPVCRARRRLMGGSICSAKTQKSWRRASGPRRAFAQARICSRRGEALPRYIVSLCRSSRPPRKCFLACDGGAPVVVPWSLDLSTDLEPLLDDDLRGGELRRPGLRSAAAALRELVFRELGVPLPPARLNVNADLP